LGGAELARAFISVDSLHWLLLGTSLGGIECGASAQARVRIAEIARSLVVAVGTRLIRREACLGFDAAAGHGGLVRATRLLGQGDAWCEKTQEEVGPKALERSRSAAASRAWLPSLSDDSLHLV
jgi:hypothetical protein